jgi:hypothetical protein
MSDDRKSRVLKSIGDLAAPRDTDELLQFARHASNGP